MSFELATLGGGCFWCLEAVYQELDGVTGIVSGYAGGHVPNPTYEQVCGKKTGHAEVVQVTFDPSVLTYRELLEVFFATHDPTTLNRQGNDFGPQYRSIILTQDDAQADTARGVIAEFSAEHVFDDPIVTEVVPLTTFYAGEAHHQNYYRSHSQQPYCSFVISPKLAKFRQKFASRMKTTSE
jgi:peptide-methionine (S)-S-oxide reductase